MTMRLLTHLMLLLLTVASSLFAPLVEASPCPGAIRTNVVNFRAQIHFVCLQPTTPPRLDVISYGPPSRLVQSIKVDERNPDKISSFVDDEANLRIILAVPNRVNGTSVYSIDQNGNRLPEIHTVSTQYVDQLNTWRLDLSLEWQLAIANQPAYEPGVLHGQPTSQRQPLPEFKPMISIYSWHATYFDRYQLIYLPQDGHVSKLEPMNINGQEFLIVAMDSIRADKDPAFGVDSLIYRLDFGSGELEWKEFQRLSTKFAHDVKPFTLTHRASFQRDYYVAVLGRIKVTRDLVRAGGRPINVTDEEDGLIIYKYLGDEFVKTHAYPAQDMTKLEAINYGQGDTFVIMALLSEKTRQVALLSFDGLNFQALPNPNMVPTRRPSSRQRRTMTNLQLFLVPPNNVDSRTVEENNETVAKRTLDDNNSNSNDRLAAPMPMLSLSDPELFSADDFDVTNASSKIVYQIPTNEIVPSESKEKQTTDAGEDKLHTKREFVGADPKEELLSWCKSTINSVLLDNFDAISKQIQLLPRVDQNKPIELDGDLVIEDDLHVSNLLFVRQLGDKQQILVENNAPNFTHTFHEIQQVHQEIDQIKNRVDQILVDDGSEQNVFNQILFDTLVVDCQQQPGPYDPRMPYFTYNRLSCPHIGDIRATLMNNRNISNIQRQALLTGRSMIIERDVRFEHLVLHGSVNITRTLNGIPINEIIFKKGFVGGPISGHKDFKNGLFSQSRLNVGNWRGTNLDRIEFFTSSGDQAITSMRVTQAIIDSSFNNQTSHIKRLNGLDLGQHLSQIALSGADNQFETPILFDELVLNGPIHMVGGLSRLSSIDLEELWSHTMFKQANQNISAPMDFAGSVEMSHGGNIVVNGPVNGFWLNPREILMQDRDYRLPNPIIFDGSLDVRSLQARRALNGIQVIFNPATRRQELALLYDEGDQQITGDKVFTSIHLGGRSAILGNINGHLNLSQLYSLANSFGQPHYFPRIKLTGNDIRIADRANIHISSTINGVPTSQLCSLALSTYNKTSAAYRSLRFEQPINLKSLRCSTINGFSDLASTFLTKYGNQNVLGDLRLTNGAIFNTTLSIQSTLNGLNVGALSRAILRSMNETRTGHKDIHGDLVLEDLITDRINELRLSNIFLARADSPQVLRAPVTFDHLDIENVLNVGGNLMIQSFNQLNVTDLMTNTLTYDTPQVILNHVELDTLQVLGNSNLQSPLVNGRNLQRLFSDAVLYDVGQQILAPKIFRGPVEFAERMYMRHRIDGLSFEDIRANLLLLSDDLIDGDLILNNDCTIQKVLEIQSRSINDIDLDVFIRNMIRDGQPLRVAANGSIRFKDVIAKDVVVGGTVQGLDLSREAIWRPKLPTQVQQLSPPIVAPAAPQLVQQQPAAAPWLQLLPLPSPLLPPHPPQSQIILPMPQQQQQRPQQLSAAAPPQYNELIIPQSDYEAISKARALADLSHLLNKELPINFYYEIVQKHPLLGPLMHHARDSLFLKGTGKAGEPCLQHGQTIAILSKGDQKPPFTQTSRIQDTSKPRSISSAANYLFILDEDPSVQVLVYLWDHKSSLYELQERLALDTNSSSTPTSVKAFMSADRACLAVIGSSGASIYCQPKLGARFSERTSLATSSLIDLDVWPIGNTSQVFVATISHQETRQIGDLNVVIFDTTTKQVMKFASKVLIKPLKLHFFRGAAAMSAAPSAAPPKLAVSEAITSNDLDKASTRIFSVELSEIQEITDSEVHDIQSVALDDFVSLLFFRSAHTLSIYSPARACPQTLALLHRIPTKGANKFLVFGDRLSHFVVLSRDCDERGSYSTLILKYTSRVVV